MSSKQSTELKGQVRAANGIYHLTDCLARDHIYLGTIAPRVAQEPLPFLIH